MRKLVKLLTITTIASSAALQVTACKDDSKYNSFINEVNQSATNSTAFFGFLGSADDETSFNLQTSFDVLNQKETNGKTKWQNWIDKNRSYLDGEKLKNIHLRYYQGPYHQDKPSDIVNSFWNDKSISWQQNIFTWIYNNTKNNPHFRKPHGVDDVKEITTKKDDSKNKKDMFTKLPIVFIVSKGKLITAGEEWIKSSDSNKQFEAIKNFVLANLFLPAGEVGK